jgi:hypothetical protein
MKVARLTIESEYRKQGFHPSFKFLFHPLLIAAAFIGPSMVS